MENQNNSSNNEPTTETVETCSNCDQSKDDCACQECRSCCEMQESFCDNCDRCGDCCECATCSGRRCGNRVDSVCDNCDKCSDCCGCYFCERCESRVFDLGCGDCNTCTNCDCQCESDGPDIRFFSAPSKPKFHTAKINEHKLNPSKRFIAAEIEVSEIGDNAGIDTAVAKWYGAIVKDGSLPETGFEINTSPASGDSFVKQVTEICDKLKESNAKVTTECGLHVHIDARDLTYYGIRRLATIYSAIENVLFQAVSPSRRESRYCEPCGERYRNNIGKLTDYKNYRNYSRKFMASAKPAKNVSKARDLAKAFKHSVYDSVYGTNDIRYRKKDKYDGARYAALNLHSWYYRGTVECRMFNGTVLADKIVAWGVMWALIVDAANTMTDKEIENIIPGPYNWPNPDNRDNRIVAQKDFLFKIIGNNPSIRAFMIDRWKQHSVYDCLKNITTESV